MRLKKIFQILPMKRLSSLKYKLVSLPIIGVLNLALIVGVIMGVYQNINLNLDLSRQKAELESLENKKPVLSDSKYQEEFNELIRSKNVIIDQHSSKFSEDDSKALLGEYSMSLKGGYSDFMNYLKHIDKLKIVNKINSLDMKNESDHIRMNIDLEVLYEKD